MDTLSIRIKQIRSGAGLTQDDFSQLLGIHKNTLRRWENGQGQPDTNMASEICQRFAISPYWLLSGSGPMLEKDRDIKLVAGPGTKAGDMADYKLSEVSGGPQFDATMAQLQARLIQLERERNEAKEAELRAKDEALKAKDQALEALQALAFKGKEKGGPSIDDEPETPMMQYGVPQSGRKNIVKK